MKQFKTIHKVPKHGLLATHKLSNVPPTSILTSESSKIITDIRSICPGLPQSTTANVRWNNEIPSNVLAWTYSNYKKEENIWVSSNHFDIEFNPRFNWHVDNSCSTQASTHYDLRTAMIHEILHGIGFSSTITENKNAYPSKYDTLLRTENGQNAIVNNKYVGSFGDNIYIEHIQMYNPSPYSTGSSFSHVSNDGNLMSWSQDSCHREIGSSTRYILSRLGYGCEHHTNGKNVVENNHLSLILAISGGMLALCILISFCKYCGSQKRKKRKFNDNFEEALLSRTSF